VNGEMVSSNDETRDCCRRVLDLSGGQADELRMREWVEGGCRQDTVVEVVSTVRHVRGDTKDRSEWMTTVTSNAPGHIESEGVRKRITSHAITTLRHWPATWLYLT
jgi:hypothetical protein